MGCLEFLYGIVEVYFDLIFLQFLFPWFDPDPDEERNMRMYGILAVILLGFAFGCLIKDKVCGGMSDGWHIAQWITLVFGSYFSFLTLFYFIRSR